MNKQNKNGFTLIEILVVISIIGFIASSAVYALNDARLKARDAKRLSDIKTLSRAVEMYYDDNDNLYPDAPGWSTNTKCGGNNIEDIPLLSNYINPVPDDPVSSNGHCYYYNDFNFRKGYQLLMLPYDISLIDDGMGCQPGYYCIGENWQ